MTAPADARPVRRHADIRPVGRRRLPGALGLALACSLALAVGSGGAAWAESAAEAELAARQAAAEVSALQRQVDLARAEYQAALDGLAGAVTRSVSADEQAMLALAEAREAEAEQGRTVRALYVSGGSLALVESMLSAESPGELATRWAVSDSVVSAAGARVESTTRVGATSVTAAAASRRAATRRIGTIQDVEAAFARLALLLDQQQAILDRLDARASSLAAAEEAAARIAAERAAAAAAAAAGAGQVTAAGIPARFERLYRDAATTCEGLPWPVLAAIGQVESGHGSNMGPSSAGAMGPMQFLPSTFSAYAVDGDGDGDKDIWDPADSIFSAARYLCANGGGGGPRALYSAIYRYNHADWYVQLVIGVAAQIARRAGEPVPVADR
ncbi:MAG: lytic transglycosylase domain-containing protein [Actinomycetota bacterium]|nr:lytic transglycosylase domain-containing protein [Actinomycetota bacterium]MDH5277608.1 lytic transglycosylase domain-containing protein [Actinomycetota bacterium]